MKNKVVTLEQAVSAVHDGQTILFGDWHGEISAEEVITGVIERASRTSLLSLFPAVCPTRALAG